MYFIYHQNHPSTPLSDINGTPATFHTREEAVINCNYLNLGRKHKPYHIWQIEGGIIMPQTYYKFTTDEGTEYTVTDDKHDPNPTWFFVNLSKRLCFSDCSNELVTEIYFEGKPIHYGGWKPNMLYTFYDENNTLIWAQAFPHWDH